MILHLKSSLGANYLSVKKNQCINECIKMKFPFVTQESHENSLKNAIINTA